MKYKVILQNTIDSIEKNLSSKISIDDLSKESHQSVYDFQRLFAFVIGVTIGDYIRKRRLYEAGIEIVTTDMSIGDIAANYQYFNHSPFTRAFKQFHGHTPIEIREKGISLVRVFKKITILEDNIEFNIIELPDMRMARSGNHPLDEFDEWWSKRFNSEKHLFPKDFMWFNEQKENLEWLYAVAQDEDTSHYDTFLHPGGLYATITTLDTDDDRDRGYQELQKKIEESPFYTNSTSENDPLYHTRYPMGHVSTPVGFNKHQFTMYIPIIRK